MDTLGKIFHVNFLGYAHWLMSIRIYQMKDHSIFVDQAHTNRWKIGLCGDYKFNQQAYISC